MSIPHGPPTRPTRHASCGVRSEEHTSELQSRRDLVCRLLLEKNKREGQRAVKIKQKPKDAVDGALMNAYLALIYPRVGQNDLTIFFFFNDPATTDIYTLSLHDALPI